MFAFSATAAVPEPMTWTVLVSPSGGFHWNQVVVASPPGLTLPLSVAVVLVTLLAARVVAVGAAALTDEAVAAPDMSIVTAMTDATVSGARMRLMMRFFTILPSGRPAGSGATPGRTDLVRAVGAG